MFMKSSALLFKRASTFQSAFALRQATAVTQINCPPTPLMSIRQFNADNRTGGADENSHDDFQPQSKAQTSTEVTEHISQWISENDIVIFMKGTRKMPQCGFSRYVTVLMNAYGVGQYKDVNVLADETLRTTIKEYSNWPTIPQVYIKGEFVGGCDIMKEMHEDGTLRELLIQSKIIKE